jgi:hypothetical protein
MARSLEEIYNSMITRKQTFASMQGLLPGYNLSTTNPYRELLDEINSESKVAVWKLDLFIVAHSHYVQEKLWDEAKSEMQEIADNAIVGSTDWNEELIRSYQHGFNLVFNPNTYTYEYQDTTSQAAIAARIVSQVSVEETNVNPSGLIIKVAKGEQPNLQPLDKTAGGEFDSLLYSFIRRKFAGVDQTLISDNGDDIKFRGDLYYDGSIPLADVKTAVEPAINAYLSSPQGKRFNGVFLRNGLIDKLQELVEVYDFHPSDIWCKRDIDTNYTTVDRSYEPYSGYFKPVTLGSWPNASEINYIAQ